MMLVDALEGCAKNPLKIGFFEHPLARCRRNRKTRRKTKKGPKKSNTHFWGGLENGQEVVPPSFSQKSGFSKSSKKTTFIVFPEKMGGNHFFSKKAMLQGGRT